MTSKFAGRELVLWVGTSATPVAQVTNVDPAGSSRDLIDASAYGDDWKDYIVGQQDGDELALEVAYDPSDNEHMTLISTYEGGESEDFGLSHTASGFAVTFPAIITKLSRGASRDGLLTMTLSLKILSPGVQDESL